MRTKEGLAAARASGKRLGRPKGKLGQSKLNGKEDDIQRLLTLKVSKASIAKITGVDRSTLYHFMRSRNLFP
jgi:DNA invertase Pin-like site-specific DNA recombinase